MKSPRAPEESYLFFWGYAYGGGILNAKRPLHFRLIKRWHSVIHFFIRFLSPKKKAKKSLLGKSGANGANNEGSVAPYGPKKGKFASSEEREKERKISQTTWWVF